MICLERQFMNCARLATGSLGDDARLFPGSRALDIRSEGVSDNP